MVRIVTAWVRGRLPGAPVQEASSQSQPSIRHEPQGEPEPRVRRRLSRTPVLESSSTRHEALRHGKGSQGGEEQEETINSQEYIDDSFPMNTVKSCNVREVRGYNSQ